MPNYTKNLGLELPLANEFYSIEKFNANSQKIDSVAHNENLLDNPWFTINQRDSTVATENSDFIADRWHANNGTSISGNIVTVPSGATLMQRYEDGITAGYIGKVMTLSVMLQNGTIISESFTYPSTGTTLTICDNDDFYCQVYSGTSNLSQVAIISRISGLNVKAAKLEYGSHSTLANDSVPNYASELLKCQRYFQRINPHTNQVFYGINQSTTRLKAWLPYVRKRIKPTFTASSNFSATVDNTKYNVTGGTFAVADGIGVDSARLCIDHTAQSSMTSATPSWCIIHAGYVDISADL